MKNPSGSYVYAVSVDGVVRYIGKGRGKRLRHHANSARKLLGAREKGGRPKAIRFHNRLAKAIAAGKRIDEAILFDGLADSDAYDIERKEIAARRHTLWNQTDGGSGVASGEIMSSLLRARWARATPDEKSRVLGKSVLNPTVRKNNALAHKDLWKKASPEVRKKHSEAVKAALEKTETRQKNRDRMKVAWADPVTREKLLATRKAAITDEYRAKQAAGTKSRWADGSLSAAHMAAKVRRAEAAT